MALTHRGGPPEATWGSRRSAALPTLTARGPALEVPARGLWPGPLFVPKGAQWKSRLPVAFQGSTHLSSSTQSRRRRQEPRVQEGKMRHDAVR